MTGVFSRRRTVLAGMLAALAVAACESSTSTQKTIEPGRIIVTASVAGTPISTVVVEVSASDIATPLIFNLQMSNGTASGTVTVPAGSARTFTIRAYNTDGVETHRGSKTIDVMPGRGNPSVTIAVLSLGGDQPIVAHLTSHSVTVALAAGSAANVAVGATTTLVATIKDADDNDIIPGPGELVWATSAPAIAGVDGNGVVTGVLAGTATIGASYRGAGGSFTVTVQ